MKTETFPTEQAAWDYLESEETTNGHSEIDPCFLYRGQNVRHFRKWPPKDEPGLGFKKHQFEFDSLIPTDYRGSEEIIEKGGYVALPDKYGDCAAVFRSVLTFACIAEHGESLSGSDHTEVMKWLSDCESGKHGETFDAPGSVGQHYGFHTCFLDATSNLEVAFWFATRDFNSGQYIASGDSTIYRIKLDALEDSCRNLNTALGLTGRERYRFVDIRSTPPPLGQRAKNQSGWSLICFESPGLLRDLIQSDGIVAITFPRTPGPCARNILPKDFIAPSGENLLKIFEDVRAGNLFSRIRQQCVDDHINNNPSCISCASYRINLTDPKWKDWIL